MSSLPSCHFLLLQSQTERLPSIPDHTPLITIMMMMQMPKPQLVVSLCFIHSGRGGGDNELEEKGGSFNEQLVRMRKETKSGKPQNPNALSIH